MKIPSRQPTPHGVRFLCLTTVLAATCCLAAPGDLDPGFNGTGRVSTPGGTFPFVYDLTLWDANKIAVVGQADSDFAIICYNPDGTLDTSFSGDGVDLRSVGSGFEGALAVTTQTFTDGKIVLAGTTTAGPDNLDFVLMRYNVDGTLDTSFDGDGVVTTSLSPSGNDSALAVAQQSSGKIIAAGSAFTGGTDRMIVARYTTAGALDNTFGFLGANVSGFSGRSEAQALAMGGSDSFILGGAVGDSPARDFALVRFTVDGALDTSFGTGGTGRVTTAIGAGDDLIHGLVIQPDDGKLVAVGQAQVGTSGYPYDFAVARYHSDGTLDTSFGTNGIVTTDFLGGDDFAYDVRVQEDEKIIVSGTANNGSGLVGGPKYFAVIRYNRDGTLDTSFGAGGKVLTEIAADGFQGARGLVTDPSGKILVSGYGPADFQVVRYKIAQGDARVALVPSVSRGDNLYNLTGAGQTQIVRVRAGGTKSAYVGVQNDGGKSDRFLIRGTRRARGFKVKYFGPSGNVTTSIIAGSLDTGTIGIGGIIYLIRVKLKADSTSSGTPRKLSFLATSQADPSAHDQAVISARIR